MVNYSLELSIFKPKEDDLPGLGISQIHIQTFTQSEDGVSFITPRCCCFEELNHEIVRLKKELDSIRDRARAIYKTFPK
jgi:hypothetical protein